MPNVLPPFLVRHLCTAYVSWKTEWLISPKYDETNIVWQEKVLGDSIIQCSFHYKLGIVCLIPQMIK